MEPNRRLRREVMPRGQSLMPRTSWTSEPSRLQSQESAALEELASIGDGGFSMALRLRIASRV